MPRAIWNGKVIADSDEYELVEGNVYFPPDAIDQAYFHASDHHTTCIWKGVASYYHVEVDGCAQRERRVVLSQPESRREEHYQLRCFLARRHRRGLTLRRARLS